MMILIVKAVDDSSSLIESGRLVGNEHLGI